MIQQEWATTEILNVQPVFKRINTIKTIEVQALAGQSTPYYDFKHRISMLWLTHIEGQTELGLQHLPHQRPGKCLKTPAVWHSWSRTMPECRLLAG